MAIEEGELPDAVFASRLRSGTLSMAAATVCLSEASERRLSEKKLGQTALAWLWDRRGALIYPDDNDLVYAMVDLLVREGQEQEVWRWMSCASTRPKRELASIRYEWRDTALKGLLMSKARMSTDHSLDNAIEAFLRSTTLLIPGEGASSWMFQRVSSYKSLRAHEKSPSINRGRRWDYVWPNTSVGLWEEAARALPYVKRGEQSSMARLAMYHVRAPDPEPMRKVFENAMGDSNHPLRNMKLLSSRGAFRTHAIHASDELRLIGRHDEAAKLDAAYEEIMPWPQEYGDRRDREGIFAQGKPAKKLPFPKFK